MPKSRDAFRTISEVAEWLGTQPHVLRFWESKFSQIRPVKRAGGRRYYRPSDMMLLGGIKKLLHDDGMTIKGVQKLLRERGVKEITALSRPVDDEDAQAAAIEASIARDLPEAIEKPEIDPIEAQIAELQDRNAEDVPAEAPSPKRAVPKNPLADVSDSWSMREGLISALMATQGIQSEHRGDIAKALSSLRRVAERHRAAKAS